MQARQEVLADRLHRAAIRLLRRLRAADEAAALSAPRLSALSVLVYGGPMGVNALAQAEQVRPPTMSRLVAGLEADGLLRRRRDPDDARRQRLEATAAGRRLLEAGRRRRVRMLADGMARLTPAEQSRLAELLPLLERLAVPDPGYGKSDRSKQRLRGSRA